MLAQEESKVQLHVESGSTAAQLQLQLVALQLVGLTDPNTHLSVKQK